jgi:hypothetical protein
VPNPDGTETYEFLSDEWLVAVKALRDEYTAQGVSSPVALTVNLVVTEVPFSATDLLAHVDTSNGGLEIEEGHLERADLAVTVDWLTAKALLVDGNPQAAMGAFMEGKVRIEGDVSKLIAFQNGVANTGTQHVAARIRAITT